MKALHWQQYLQAEYKASGKSVFHVAELANIASQNAHVLNVELSRLMKAGVLVRYAQGRYGLPDVVAPEQLLTQIDTSAYITGHWALFYANHIDQRPTVITCFTARRHNRSRVRTTPLGRLEFTTVRRPIYSPPELPRPVATPEQALCDYVYLCFRRGLRPESLVHFRNLQNLSPSLATHAENYPRTVQSHLRQLCPAAFAIRS